MADERPSGARLEFRLLGPIEAWSEERPVPLGGERQRALLALLLLHAGKVVSSDVLIDELFGSQASGTAANALQAAVSRLRRALEDRDAQRVLITRPPGYVLQVEPDQLDLARFERLLTEGRTKLSVGDPVGAEENLREALGLWNGQPLADLGSHDFAERERRRLTELRLEAAMERVDADLALGRAAELTPELEELIAENPYQERLRGQMMLALYRAGRQADALETYREARRLLRDELGLEPSKALQDLEKAILIQDPALEVPSKSRPPSTRPDPPADVPDSIVTAGESVARLLPRSRARLVGVVALATAALAAVLIATAVGVNRLSANAPTAVAPNSVGMIDPNTNRIVASVPVGEGPTRVLASTSGVWILNEVAQSITLIDPATHEPLRTFSVGITPADLAIDRQGLWVASPSGQLLLVDPQTQTITRRSQVHLGPKVLPNDTSRVGNLASGFGSLWVESGGQTLTRTNPATGTIEATIHGVSTGAGTEGGLAVGKRGIWAANLNQVTLVDPASNTAEQVPLAAVSVWHINGLAANGDDLWFSDVGNNRVWEVGGIRPQVIRSVAVGLNPLGLAVGHGSLWVANSGDGTVTRIDPATGDVLATIKVGGAPTGIAVSRNAVWVTVD